MNIGSLLSQNTRKFPNVLVIEWEDRNYTKNSDHFVFTFFAIAKIGAVAVPINFRLTSSEVHYILQQSEAKLVVCDLEFEEIITTAKEDSDVGTVITIGEPRTLGYHYYESALSNNRNEPAHIIHRDFHPVKALQTIQ